MVPQKVSKQMDQQKEPYSESGLDTFCKDRIKPKQMYNKEENFNSFIPISNQVLNGNEKEKKERKLKEFKKLNILTYNCRGLNDNEKRNNIFKKIKNLDMDIIMLQETHSKEKYNRSLNWSGESIWNSNQDGKGGVAILFKKDLEVKVIHKYEIKGRAILILVDYNLCTFLIANIYAPNEASERKNFFNQLLMEMIKICENDNFKEKGIKIIIGGDFNMVESTNDDKIGGNLSNGTSGTYEINKIKNKLNLVDIWRELNVNKKEFTWCNGEKNIWIRLDRFYISKDMRSDVNNCKIENWFDSDHKPVWFSIDLKEIKVKAPYWILNTSYLKEDEYIKRMKNILDFWIKNKNKWSSMIDWWERLKTTIKEFSLKYGKIRKKKQKDKKEKLIEEIKELENMIHDDINNEERIKDLNEKIETLKKIEFEELEGYRIRSKLKWELEGERTNKFFLRLEKEKKGKDYLKIEEDEILNFYSNL